MKTAVANLTNLTPIGLVAKAVFVFSKMNGNALFTSPLIAALDTARKALELAIAAATDGGHSAFVDRRLKELAVITILIELAAYVTITANGDETIILAAGFDVRRKRELLGELPAPSGLSTKATDKPGRLVSRWKPEDGAAVYQIFMNEADPDDETKWLLIDTSTRANFTKDGLTTGKTYWFRVNCIGAAGISPMSDPSKGVPV